MHIVLSDHVVVNQFVPAKIYDDFVSILQFKLNKTLAIRQEGFASDLVGYNFDHHKFHHMIPKIILILVVSTLSITSVSGQNKCNDYPLNVPIEAYSYPPNKYAIIKPHEDDKASPVIEATVLMSNRSAGFSIKGGLEGLSDQKVYTIAIVGEGSKVGLKSSYRVVYSTENAVVGTGTVEFLDACLVDMIWARFSVGRIIKVTFKLGSAELALDLGKI